MHDRGLSLATAESCTGGMVSALLTEVPGASATFLGGWVTYSNAMKHAQLDVPDTLLAHRGAVSAPVACAMAEGARAHAGAHCSVAITGIAGPGGSIDSQGHTVKPAGLVYIATACHTDIHCEEHHFSGTRHAVRLASAQAALTQLTQHVRDARTLNHPAASTTACDN